MSSLSEIICSLEHAQKMCSGNKAVTVGAIIFGEALDYLHKYADMCPRDAREFIDCETCKQCSFYDEIMKNRE